MPLWLLEQFLQFGQSVHRKIVLDPFFAVSSDPVGAFKSLEFRDQCAGQGAHPAIRLKNLRPFFIWAVTPHLLEFKDAYANLACG